MAEKLRFTLRWLKSLDCSKLVKYSDAGMLGLQVWTRKSGPQFYFVMKHEGKQYNTALGRFPEMSLEDAREEVLRRRGALASFGRVDAPSHSNPTLEDALRLYNARTDLRPDTYVWIKSSSQVLGGLREKRIIDLTVQDFEELKRNNLHRLPACGEAIRLAKCAINYLKKELDLSELPNRVQRVRIPKREPRKRFLNMEEAPRLIAELERMTATNMYGIQAQALLMMIYTGQRKSNVLKMEYSEINNGIWTIPASKSKNKKPIRVPLNSEAIGILNKLNAGKLLPTRGFVFTRLGKPMNKVQRTLETACKRCNISDFHTHDLRRTLASWMLMSGVDIAVVSKTLGHSSIAITEQVYAHLLPEKISSATELAIERMKKGQTK